MDEKGPSNLGKAIVFRSGNRLWACELNKVKEIVRTTRITPLPNGQKGVLGVINVRGEVLPVVSRWPGQESSGPLNVENKKKLTVMILQSGKETVGLLADEVKSMEDIHAYDLGDMQEDSTCRVHLSESGHIPLVDCRFVIEYLKSGV